MNKSILTKKSDRTFVVVVVVVVIIIIIGSGSSRTRSSSLFFSIGLNNNNQYVMNVCFCRAVVLYLVEDVPIAKVMQRVSEREIWNRQGHMMHHEYITFF